MNAADTIARAPTGVTAFVGRTLKGPVNEPVRIASFAQYEHVFGGLWQPSMLSYAVEQFFENGGRAALIVRVASGARPSTLSLPAGGGVLSLIGVNPGSREYLRAAVDYDGIRADDPGTFNLVLQRVRQPGSELIEDQEIFRKLSIDPGASRYVEEALLTSRLMRVSGAVPPWRPDRTGGDARAGYVGANADGDDGAALVDYDLIGSAAGHTGIFALRSPFDFDLLCLPALSRDHDVGLSTLTVAARFCRDRQAILLVDPPSDWTSVDAALSGMREWPFRSENAAMYFPRVEARDRLRARTAVFGSAACAAGIIARGDETWPVWAATESEDAVLRHGMRPAVSLSEADRARLAHAGINSLHAVRPSVPASISPRTLAVGTPAAASWRYLAARRLALFILSSVERGTRWLQTQHNGPVAWDAAQRQVTEFLDGLDREGAFAGSSPGESYFAICDERVNGRAALALGQVNILFGVALERPGDFHNCMVTHQPSGSRVRPVTVNRQLTSPDRVEWEIETAVLRG